MKENNIFKFATKELTQDAFICWLTNWLRIKDADEDIKKIAKNFVNAIIDGAIDRRKKYLEVAKDSKEIQKEIQILENYILNEKNKNIKIEIKRQIDRIDVLLVLTKNEKKLCIIVEDKINTNEHDNQIERYKEKVETYYDPQLVLTCYYKIYDEFNLENKHESVDKLFTLEEVNKLFALDKKSSEKYKQCIKNATKFQYLKDYIDYIEEFNNCIEKFKEIKLSNSIKNIYENEELYKEFNIISKEKVIEVWNCRFLKELEEKLKTEEHINLDWGISSRGNKPTYWLNLRLMNLQINDKENNLFENNPIIKINLDSESVVTLRIGRKPGSSTNRYNTIEMYNYIKDKFGLKKCQPSDRRGRRFTERT